MLKSPVETRIKCDKRFANIFVLPVSLSVSPRIISHSLPLPFGNSHLENCRSEPSGNRALF